MGGWRAGRGGSGSLKARCDFTVSGESPDLGARQEEGGEPGSTGDQTSFRPRPSTHALGVICSPAFTVIALGFTRLSPQSPLIQLLGLWTFGESKNKFLRRELDSWVLLEGLQGSRSILQSFLLPLPSISSISFVTLFISGPFPRGERVALQLEALRVGFKNFPK